MAVAYFDVRGGSGGRGGMAVEAAEELAPLDAVTVEDTDKGLSFPRDDSFRFSLSLSLSFSVFGFCATLPSKSFVKYDPSYEAYPLCAPSKLL